MIYGKANCPSFISKADAWEDLRNICFIFLLKIFIQLFWLYSFASLNPARSSPPPCPQNFMFSPKTTTIITWKTMKKSQNLKVKTGKQANIKKISKTNKHPSNNKRTKTPNPKTKSAPSNPDQMEAVLCWLTTPCHGGLPWMWFLYPVTPHWRRLNFLCPPSISCKQLLSFGGTLCLFPLLSAEILSVLNLCKFRVCCPSLCEFICASGLSCLDDTFLRVSDWLLTLSTSSSA